VALGELVVFVGVDRAALRKIVKQAAGRGRGVEKQRAGGFAAGVLPGMRDAKVVITDIDNAGAQAVVGKIAAAGGEAICLHQDVSIEEEWPHVIEATERRFGQLNVMVANAGIGLPCKAIEMSLTDWRRQTAINLDGVFLSVKYAVPAMRRAGGGSIIITSSVAGLRGSAGLA
jgi:NAD(P)-dependent dehydrogenase (short-subunit alcohol dehydrogenase family)